MEQSKNLVVKHTKQSNLICQDGKITINDIEKVCEKNPISFIKNLPEQTKIRDIEKTSEFRNLLGAVIEKAMILCGIKEKMDDLTKEDLKKLVFSRFKHLSLIEIHKAFENERYGLYEAKNNHYQYFGAEYVSDILIKYEKWKKEIKITHNISNQKTVSGLLSEITESQKKELMDSAILRCWEEYKSMQEINNPFLHVFEELIKRGFIGKISDHQRYYTKKHREAKELVKKELQEEAIVNPHKFKSLKTEIEKLKKEGGNKAEIKTYELVLKDFFQNRINKKLPIEELIKNNKN